MRLPFRGVRRRVLVAVPVLLLGAGLAVATSGSASAVATCTASYATQSQWAGGFVASVTVTNNGASALTGWTVTFAFGGDQKVTSSWSASVTQSGENITSANASYNGSLGTGASTSFGFQGTYTSSDAAPASLTCTPAGVTPSPSPTPTSPSPSPSTTTSSPPPSGPAPQLHVSGNQLVDASGNTVVLHGVNRSGAEFACVQNNGIFSGPVDQASITAIKSWTHVTAVRVPLNEACWNGESYVTAAYAGTTYQQAIEQYVNLLNANGIVAILDLHWTDGAYTGASSACSDATATCQKPMPDAAESVPFWTSVANAFKGNDAVIFDLFNEPYPDIATGSETQGWQCWLNGGSSCPGFSYTVAGMQTLVNAVRSTGANNVLMLGGLTWSNDMTQWLTYEPTDPDHNLVASWHSYNFNGCSTQSCWTSQIAPVIAKVPLIAGEIGENDCAGTYIDPLTAWLESQGAGFLAWTWDAWTGVGCNPVLITDYTGTPTSSYGSSYEAILKALP